MGGCQSLKNRLEYDLGEYSLALEELRQEVESAVGEIDLEAPELPEPETPHEPDGWLFDSARDYEDQLAVYKERKNGSGDGE